MKYYKNTTENSFVMLPSGTAPDPSLVEITYQEYNNGVGVLTLEETLKKDNELLKQQIEALSKQNDFQEELIVELAGVVYA